MDHASDVVSLLTATSTNGGGESQPKEFCFVLAVGVFRASAVYQRDDEYRRVWWQSATLLATNLIYTPKKN